MHWLCMISRAIPRKKIDAEKLSKEAHEFVLILSASIRTSKNEN